MPIHPGSKPSTGERESDYSHLCSPYQSERVMYAFKEFTALVNRPDDLKTMFLGSGFTFPQIRFASLTAALIQDEHRAISAHEDHDRLKLVFLSPHDDSSYGLRHSVEIRSRAAGMAELVGIPPQMARLEFGFKNSGVIEGDNVPDLKKLIEQTGYCFRIVMCDPQLLKETSEGINAFAKATREDGKTRPNFGISSFLSNIGIGTVYDVSIDSGMIHVTTLKKGQETAREDWQIQSGFKPEEYKFAFRRGTWQS